MDTGIKEKNFIFRFKTMDFESIVVYSLPFVSLRGVPAFRYQDKLMVLETEERWNFSRRWSLVAFEGGGKRFYDHPFFGA